jgi:SAM-dependent methyltransferase
MDLLEASDVSPRHRHPWEIARLWVLRRLIAGRVDLSPGSSVIDIGCGDAFVAGELARTYPDTNFYGIDAAFTPDIVARRQQDLPPNVHLLHDLDSLPPLAPAALVLLMDVIEHIGDDHGFLIELGRRPIVGRDTHVIVTVPAYPSLFSAHDVFLKHFRRYTNRQLRHRLQGAGLQVIDIGYFFASLLPFRIIGVLAERLSPSRTAAGTGLSEYSGSRVTTTLLSALLKADAFTALALHRVGISLPGLSNYAICRTSA